MTKTRKKKQAAYIKSLKPISLTNKQVLLGLSTVGVKAKDGVGMICGNAANTGLDLLDILGTNWSITMATKWGSSNSRRRTSAVTLNTQVMANYMHTVCGVKEGTFLQVPLVQ